ncbi:MAG TPA: DUF6285 domain-containing protein [Caulobacteraceae bacterium]|jgi:hypothetical protein|nr:DUF6285 domain-containing protein [Caulobacteraceae bacterium]
MQDPPTPSEVLAAVARFLKDEVAPATAGHLSFQARVAANALEMMRRELELSPPQEAAERTRLRALLGQEGDLPTLTAELSRRLAAGEIDLAAPGLADHLWTTALQKMAVDQPTYAAYRASLAERGAASGPQAT